MNFRRLLNDLKRFETNDICDRLFEEKNLQIHKMKNKKQKSN